MGEGQQKIAGISKKIRIDSKAHVDHSIRVISLLLTHPLQDILIGRDSVKALITLRVLIQWGDILLRVKISNLECVHTCGSR